MPSKFAGIINDLPAFAGDVNYQEKVEAVKKQICEEAGFDPSSSALARRYRDLRGSEDVVSLVAKERIEAIIKEFGKEGIEAILSAVNMRIEAVSQMMIAQFEVDGDISSLKFADGGAVRVQYEPYAQVEDKAALRRWALANGLEESLALPWMTVNSITKQRLLDGDPEPPGVKAYAKTKVVLTK